MPFQLIFETDARHDGKDIVFFAAYTCMVLQVVYISMDSSLLPPRSDLLAVYD